MTFDEVERFKEKMFWDAHTVCLMLDSKCSNAVVFEAMDRWKSAYTNWQSATEEYLNQPPILGVDVCSSYKDNVA